MIWNVVFANKSRKLGWIWMKLGRWGWGLKRLSLARFQRNRAIGFGESAKNGSQRRCFLWRERCTTSATFLGSISAKLPKNTCPGGGSRHMVSYSRKVSIKGSNLPKNPLFRVPYLWSAYGSQETFCDAYTLSIPYWTSHRCAFPIDFCWGMYRDGSPICSGIIIHCTFSSCYCGAVWVINFEFRFRSTSKLSGKKKDA